LLYRILINKISVGEAPLFLQKKSVCLHHQASIVSNRFVRRTHHGFVQQLPKITQHSRRLRVGRSLSEFSLIAPTASKRSNLSRVLLLNIHPGRIYSINPLHHTFGWIPHCPYPSRPLPTPIQSRIIIRTSFIDPFVVGS
jgi:hypothetical protein